MNEFIEVTLAKDSKKLLVNLSNILSIEPEGAGETTRLLFNSGRDVITFIIKEQYYRLATMIGKRY